MVDRLVSVNETHDLPAPVAARLMEQVQDGESAYQLAVAGGYTGTLTEWLASLKGGKGDPGIPGKPGPEGPTAYEVAVSDGFAGTKTEWLASLEGTDGASAYQIAVAGGYAGTEAEWVASLEGPQGEPGTASDADMAAVAADETSQFRGALSATFATSEYVNTLAFGTELQVADATTAELVDDPSTLTGAAMQSAYAGFTPRGLELIETQRWDALRPFSAALANRHYQRVNVAVLGDSITEGQGATQFDRRWVSKLQEQLRAHLPTSGLAGGGRGFIAAEMTGQNSFTSPASNVGGPRASHPYGPKRHSLVLEEAGHEVSFALNGTSCDLLYIGGTGGSVTYSVDGGAPVVFVIPGPLLDGQKERITFPSSGEHTLTVAWASGDSYIHGVIEYNGDEEKGIHVNDAGHYGWNTGYGSAGWLQGGFAGNFWPAGVASLGSDLLMVALGTNDPVSGISPTEHKSNIEGIISKVRAGYAELGWSAPPVLLVPYGGPANTASSWQGYVSAELEIAAEDPAVAISDLSLRLPNASLPDDLGLYADGVGHPSDKGHSMTGDALATFMLPR